MAKYCGIISLGGLAGGGHATTTNENPDTGVTTVTSSIPIAVELVDFRIGETFFSKIRVCQQHVCEFIHPGDDACIYVYKQMGITNVIVGVKSSAFPSYSIDFGRFLMMLFAQYFFGFICCGLPGLLIFSILSGRFSSLGFFVGGLGLPSYGAWTLVQAYREIQADFK